MRRTDPLPELLCPAGSARALAAAIDAGADAVYLGGKQFQARAFSESFTEEQMTEALRYAAIRGVKTYLTLNTLLSDRELPEALEYARFLYESGASALICADLGLIRALRARYPTIPIHASTQSGAHSTDGVETLARLGVERVVLARELPLTEIRSITESASVETEVFLHGALCVSQSGGCLFSSLVGGRSGNRGMCAQPCRLPYGQDYPLSLKDLCLAPHIPQLIESGVASLKIEGRMKSAAYVWHTAHIYRTLLDEGRAATEEEVRRLAEVFSRGDGFTDAYFLGGPTVGMAGVRSEEQKQRSRELAPVPDTYTPLPIRAEATIKAKTPLSLTLHMGDTTVTVTGDVPSPALRAPLSYKEAVLRLTKLGGTPFSLSPEDLALDLEEGLFVSVGQLNALRRQAVDRLSRACLPPPLAPSDALPAAVSPAEIEGHFGVFYDPTVFDGLSEEDRGFFSVCVLPVDRHGEAETVAEGVLLPPVVFDRERPCMLAALVAARERGARYAMLSGVGQLPLVREAGLIPVGGFRLNVTNRAARDGWYAEGVRDLTLSPELPLPHLRDLGGRAILYGRVPLMVLERCPVRETAGCHACKTYRLRDRTGAEFPLLRSTGHRRLLVNSLPTSMSDKGAELARYGISRGLFLFTVEDVSACRSVLGAFRLGLPLDGTRRVPKEWN